MVCSLRLKIRQPHLHANPPMSSALLVLKVSNDLSQKTNLRAAKIGISNILLKISSSLPSKTQKQRPIFTVLYIVGMHSVIPFIIKLSYLFMKEKRRVKHVQVSSMNRPTSSHSVNPHHIIHGKETRFALFSTSFSFDSSSWKYPLDYIYWTGWWS